MPTFFGQNRATVQVTYLRRIPFYYVFKRGELQSCPVALSIGFSKWVEILGVEGDDKEAAEWIFPESWAPGRQKCRCIFCSKRFVRKCSYSVALVTDFLRGFIICYRYCTTAKSLLFLKTLPTQPILAFKHSSPSCACSFSLGSCVRWINVAKLHWWNLTRKKLNSKHNVCSDIVTVKSGACKYSHAI